MVKKGCKNVKECVLFCFFVEILGNVMCSFDLKIVFLLSKMCKYFMLLMYIDGLEGWKIWSVLC